MNNIFEKTGPMALGSRLRLLSEKVTKDAQKICTMYNVDIKAKWYPVVYCLLEEGSYSKTVTQIAKEIGQSHVAVVQIIKEMSEDGMLIEKKDTEDGRKTNISLSKKGRQKVKGLEQQHKDTSIAIDKMLSQMDYNLWFALEEFEKIFNEKSTLPRVLEEKRERELEEIKIVDFEDKYKEDFKNLNKQWIEKYFKLEEKDVVLFGNPKKYIIDNGGFIFVALYNNEVAGVCCLLKSTIEKYDYELAKMTVNPKFHGKSIGLALGNILIKKAKELKASSIFLDSNTILVPAINLYKKLGFKKVITCPSPYERCDIQMELILKD